MDMAFGRGLHAMDAGSVDCKDTMARLHLAKTISAGAQAVHRSENSVAMSTS